MAGFTGQVTKAAEDLWSAIFANFREDLPEVVMISIGDGELVNRFYVVNTLVNPEVGRLGDTPVPQIFISWSVLNSSIRMNSARHLLTELLHAAAHIYCRSEDIKELAKAGHYHNARFKSAAEKFGLLVNYSGKKNGYTELLLPKETSDLYHAELLAVAHSLNFIVEFPGTGEYVR